MLGEKDVQANILAIFQPPKADHTIPTPLHQRLYHKCGI
jgi:hypothetical protein